MSKENLAANVAIVKIKSLDPSTIDRVRLLIESCFAIVTRSGCIGDDQSGFHEFVTVIVREDEAGV